MDISILREWQKLKSYLRQPWFLILALMALLMLVFILAESLNTGWPWRLSREKATHMIMGVIYFDTTINVENIPEEALKMWILVDVIKPLQNNHTEKQDPYQKLAWKTIKQGIKHKQDQRGKITISEALQQRQAMPIAMVGVVYKACDLVYVFRDVDEPNVDCIFDDPTKHILLYKNEIKDGRPTWQPLDID